MREATKLVFIALIGFMLGVILGMSILHAHSDPTKTIKSYSLAKEFNA